MTELTVTVISVVGQGSADQTVALAANEAGCDVILLGGGHPPSTAIPTGFLAFAAHEDVDGGQIFEAMSQVTSKGLCDSTLPRRLLDEARKVMTAVIAVEGNPVDTVERGLRAHRTADGSVYDLLPGLPGTVAMATSADPYAPKAANVGRVSPTWRRTSGRFAPMPDRPFPLNPAPARLAVARALRRPSAIPCRYGPFLFGLIQSGLTTAIAAALSNANRLPQVGFWSHWLEAWLPAWALIAPIVLAAAPAISRLVAGLTREDDTSPHILRGDGLADAKTGRRPCLPQRR